MNVGEILYFAPDLPFSDVDLGGPQLPVQLRQRIQGFYIEPASRCYGEGHAFAAGVILVSCIDALGRLSRNRDKVTKEDFIAFVTEHLHGFREETLSERLYFDVRCGLVHEARLKNGAQFTLESDTHIDERTGILIVNPQELASEVESALDTYVEDLDSDDTKREALADRLCKEYEKDFIAAGHPAFIGTDQGDGSELSI